MMKKRLLALNAIVLALIAALAMFQWFEVIATNESGPLLTRNYTGFGAFPALGSSLITGFGAIFMMTVSKGALRRAVAILATGVALLTLRFLFDSFGTPSDHITLEFTNVIPDAFTLSGRPAKIFYLPTLFLAGGWALICFLMILVSDKATAAKSYSRAKPAPEVGAWAALSVGIDPTDDDSPSDLGGGSDGSFDGGFDGGAGAST